MDTHMVHLICYIILDYAASVCTTLSFPFDWGWSSIRVDELAIGLESGRIFFDAFFEGRFIRVIL